MHRGHDIALRWDYKSISRARDSEINPRGGREIHFRYDRLFNKLINPNEYKITELKIIEKNNYFEGMKQINENRIGEDIYFFEPNFKFLGHVFVYEIEFEGETEVFVYINKKNLKGPGSRSRLPFYNPSMGVNRDLSIIIVQYLCNNFSKNLKVLDGLASSGIRGVRFANEIDGDFDVTINDWSEECFNLIKKNVDKYGFRNVKVENKNLNILLSDQFYDYIDVDPFGSPFSFIDSAMRSIKNDGILACTATDTATLCGVYPKVCLRRYSAIPFHSFIMHEVGIRILLGYLCREAAKYDKEIMRVLNYYTRLPIIGITYEIAKTKDNTKKFKSIYNSIYRSVMRLRDKGILKVEFKTRNKLWLAKKPDEFVIDYEKKYGKHFLTRIALVSIADPIPEDEDEYDKKFQDHC